ncbi:alanyl-tRNA editing protein [Bacteroidota bacterium]
MTKLLFQTDSYLKEFEASVIETDPDHNAIVLDQTVFYPTGGGQPHDTGKLAWGSSESVVTSVKRQEGKIWHSLDGVLPGSGAVIIGKIDWERRYDLMRTHTAMHILCGVIWRDYQAQVTGGNMEPLMGRMDFEFEQMKGELVREIEEKINLEVKAAREVSSQILPRKEAESIPDLIRTKINLLPPNLTEIRVVEILGLDLQADGGTHVANTREVGEIKIVDYKSKGRINKRLKIEIIE